jgi:RNA polymerase subunit RPABC4/transcription elongation factor Spt4
MEIDTTNHAELFRATMLMRNANMCCSDCEHMGYLKLTDTHYCPEATKALALDGYPAMIVRVDPENSAETCPMFSRSSESRNGESVPSWQDEENATERGVRSARGFTK